MSIESPAEKIWQYAMHADSINRDADDASLNVGDGRSGGDATIDFSGQLGSIPSKLSFHGLAQSQTQSQGARPLQAPSVDDLESQKENRQLPVPMGPPWPVISGTAMTATSRTEHVSTSTTGASPRVATPFAGPVTAPSNLVPLMAKQGDAIRASPMSQKAKAVSFSSPNTPPSPPTLPRTLTMPPRLNRYAPRNIDRSSQDSFAGPLPPQDLNSYVRNTAIFNNIYISRGRDGRPGEVFEHPSHVSDTTTSLSEPPPVDEINTPSQSEHRDDGPSVSQVMRAAFPSLSPMSAPDPVILARDSQSQDSQGGSGGNDSNIGSNHNSGGAISSNSHASNSQSSHFFPHASSSSSISYVPQDDVSDSTQTNTQATQPSTQPPQTDPQHITTVPSISSYPGLSLLPVPPHRRREVASLQAARLQAKAEVIPETPASTAGLSVQASAAPSLSTPAVVDSPQIQPQRSTVAHLMGKERIFENREVHTKPSSKGKGRAEQVDAPAPSVTAWATRLTKVKSARDLSVLPESLEGQNRQTMLGAASIRRRQPRQSEVVPDSQEGEELDSVYDRASSPDVPLMQAMASNSTREALHPPTPTPAAVRSPLRRGELPEGVTHTRGRGRPSSAKGYRNQVVTYAEKQHPRVDEAVSPILSEESMAVDEESDQPESPPQPIETPKPVVAVAGSAKVKREPLSKRRKREAKGGRAQRTTANTRVAGPSTRSRKRKSDTPCELPKDSEVPSTTLRPAKKRHRSIMATPPVPNSLGKLIIRVLARRTDKRNDYCPGTVSVETTPLDPIPTSTVFTVRFDDGREEDVDVEHMRQFQLEPEDVVRVTQRRKGKARVCSAQVLDVEQWNSAEMAEVHELDQGPDADDYEIEGRFLSVLEDHIHEQWNERRVSTRTLLRDQELNQPERNKCLAGLGFIITLPDIPKSKRSLAKFIEASGGLVYDDWSAIVSLNGSVEVAGKRIAAKASDMRIGKELRKMPTSTLLCLTDEPRTTPKYLIALALGVPCISKDWVVDRVVLDVEHHVDWLAYVLPAGYNPVTRMLASQAFDRAWWLKGDNLPNLISQPPVLKPFAGKAFLCIGAPDFLFSKKGFGTFPKVLLAMGALYVQAVTEIDRVNVRGQHGFDYTVVDDGEALIKYKDAAAVNVSWIKKCLVTGVEGPVPWSDREMS